MKNRDKFNHVELILKIAKLAIKIQDKEIGTCFVDIAGHVVGCDFRLFAPNWQEGKDSDFRFSLYDSDTKDEYLDKIRILEGILENGETAIPGFAEQKAKIREKKLRQLEKLQQELAEK